MNAIADHFDVAIIGSGPGGSVAATVLAQKRYRVLLVERERFPRFHTGESLLSATQQIWERIGLAERLQHSGHTFKYGGEFRLADCPARTDFNSSTVFFGNLPKSDRGPRPFAYHVERAVLDQQLQQWAVEQGATLWSETAVEQVLFESTEQGQRAVGLKCRDKDRRERTVSADFIIDASGRRCVVARQLDGIEPDPEIHTSAVYGHFRGVKRQPGYKQGLFVGYFIENGWVWLIPLADDVMSVGLVQNEPSNLAWSNDPQQVLLEAINRYKFIQELFTDAVQVGRMRTTKGLAYQTREFCGDGWLAVGDANFFVDPLYSSGVHIAHCTGELAAEVANEYLRGGRDMAAIRRYEKYIHDYRRDVFDVIRVVYRLLRHRAAIGAFLWSAGKWGNNFDTFFLRRVAAWSSGFFERHRFVMRVTVLFGRVMSAVAPRIARLWGGDGWKRFERSPNDAPALRIPVEKEAGVTLTHTGPCQAAQATPAASAEQPETALEFSL